MFRILYTEQLQQHLASWVEHLQFCHVGQTVAIDGKTLRGCHDNAAAQKPLHVVNVWANHVDFCRGQISVAEKSNKIPAVQELLETLNLKGAVIMADPMHCQKRRRRTFAAARRTNATALAKKLATASCAPLRRHCGRCGRA